MSQQAQQATTPPIDTVQFHFDGRSYNVMADLICEYVLDMRGRSLKGVVEAMMSPEGTKVAVMADTFAAMVANNFDTDAGQRIPSTEEWLRRLNKKPGAFGDACKAVADAITKLLLAASNLPTPPATTETAPPVQ